MKLSLIAACAMLAGPAIAYAADKGPAAAAKEAPPPEGAPAITEADVDARVKAAVDAALETASETLKLAQKSASDAAAQLEEQGKAHAAALARANKSTDDAYEEIERLEADLKAAVAVKLDDVPEVAAPAPGDIPLGTAEVYHPEGASSASYGGQTYEADADGKIVVPLLAVTALADHGFKMVG